MSKFSDPRITNVNGINNFDIDPYDYPRKKLDKYDLVRYSLKKNIQLDFLKRETWPKQAVVLFSRKIDGSSGALTSFSQWWSGTDSQNESQGMSFDARTHAGVEQTVNNTTRYEIIARIDDLHQSLPFFVLDASTIIKLQNASISGKLEPELKNILDLYPKFYSRYNMSYWDSVFGNPPKPGDMVSVDFIDRATFKDGILLDLILESSIQPLENEVDSTKEQFKTGKKTTGQNGMTRCSGKSAANIGSARYGYDGLTSTEKSLYKNLCSEFQPVVLDIIDTLKKEGWKPTITSTWRSEQFQLEQYNAGRTKSKKPDAHGHCRDGKPASIAVDISAEGGWNCQDNIDFFKRLGELAKERGLKWGGDFSTNNAPRSNDPQTQARYDAWSEAGIGWDPVHVQLISAPNGVESWISCR